MQMHPFQLIGLFVVGGDPPQTMQCWLKTDQSMHPTLSSRVHPTLLMQPKLEGQFQTIGKWHYWTLLCFVYDPKAKSGVHPGLH